MQSCFNSVGCYEKQEIASSQGKFKISIEGIRRTGTYDKYSCEWRKMKLRKTITVTYRVIETIIKRWLMNGFSSDDYETNLIAIGYTSQNIELDGRLEKFRAVNSFKDDGK
jgi:hypothetical protein